MNKLNIKSYCEFSPKQWDEVVNLFDGTIYHTSWFFEYMTIYHKNIHIQNYSFSILNDTEVVALIPLFVEKIDNMWQVSMGEESITSVLYDSNLKQKDILSIFQLFTRHIDEIAKEKLCSLSRFNISPLMTVSRDININFYKLFGYKDQILIPSWYVFKCDFAYVIDLSMPLEQLYSNVRRRYKSFINKTLKLANHIILDQDNLNKEVFCKYINFYYSIKGNRRTSEAFDKDYEAIKNGLEVIFICEYNDKYIGAIAIHQYNNMARYNSALTVTIDNLYPNHSLVWKSIEYLKKNNCKYYEIGEQVCDNGSYEISKKEKDLSFFKAGWGGDLYPWMKAQKEYSFNDIR
mgnify:CR=1 FL=1